MAPNTGGSVVPVHGKTKDRKAPKLGAEPNQVAECQTLCMGTILLGYIQELRSIVHKNL